MREPPLNEEQRLLARGGPVLQPVAPFLSGRPVQIDVDRVHVAQIARLVVINGARRVDAFGNPRGQLRLPTVTETVVVLREPGLLRGFLQSVSAVDLQGILISVVPGGIVVHRVGHHAGVVLRAADEPLRQLTVTPGLLGLVQLRVEILDVRKREGRQRSGLVRGLKHRVQVPHLAGREAVVSGDETVEPVLL